MGRIKCNLRQLCEPSVQSEYVTISSYDLILSWCLIGKSVCDEVRGILSPLPKRVESPTWGTPFIERNFFEISDPESSHEGSKAKKADYCYCYKTLAFHSYIQCGRILPVLDR